MGSFWNDLLKSLITCCMNEDSLVSSMIRLELPDLESAGAQGAAGAGSHGGGDAGGGKGGERRMRNISESMRGYNERMAEGVRWVRPKGMSLTITSTDSFANGNSRRKEKEKKNK